MRPTPTAWVQDGSIETFLKRQDRRNRKNGVPLDVAVRVWPTPYASDVDTYRLNSPGRQSHDGSLCSIVRRETGGHLSPDWVEWLMGWPVGWTSLEPMTELGSWFDGTWWDGEPVPRITTDKTNRTKRLRAIGNGQVPACVVSAWLTLGVMVASEGKHDGTQEQAHT